ncbi:hypothetical protein ACCO45_012653 [Purpureocillium lilacinum]|uniref:Uncharacterized protein n=2 Tax=Purpureocillium lilacinum TaxID=33203 RepID=A0ACC4D8Y9_PURLI
MRLRPANRRIHERSWHAYLAGSARFDAAVSKIRRKESVTDAIGKGRNALFSQSQMTAPEPFCGPSPRAIRMVAGIAGWLVQHQ